MPPIVETDNLTRYYGKTVGIENLSLSVDEGRIFGFLGPNGAGKTTAISILMNFLKPDTGSVKIFGRPVKWGDYTYLRRIGFLPGELALPNGFTGELLLKRWAELSGGKAPMMERTLDALSLSVKDLKRKTREYSTGMKQKLGIVGALQHLPELIILDEPTGGLDPLVKHAFLELLKEMNNQGSTIFFSSHILSEVEQIADSTAIIRNGKIVVESDIDDLKHKQHKHVFIAFKTQKDLEEFTGKYDFSPQIDGLTVRFLAPMDITRLLKAVNGTNLTDLNITTPTLEDIFLQYYENTD
ncbi:MAG: ABC transporter ATP-binding protein [FCB group bacterium]|nr:ABC transporter ATP-binding protein [FCB group bacterium]